MSDILSIIEQNSGTAVSSTSALGVRGEQLALKYLIDRGYRIVVTNFKVPVGRNSKGVQVTGEIDIIALDGETLCFVEVKTRRSEEFAPVITAVDRRKQRQISRTARVYRRIFNIFDNPHRFDVVTVLAQKHVDPVIELNKGYWTDAVFSRKTWASYSGYTDY